MYRYNEYDQHLVRERVEQFREQVARRLTGELTEDEFKPLRLLNGLYLQLHAYMLRVNIPYGTLSAAQLRKLAHIARTYDRDYGHFTTRQNIQFNWLKLADVPDLLAELAGVEMHGIQASGNSVRNITADPFAGVAADEIEDSRVYAEIIRQWYTLHPEFSYLPRKFKIAVTGSPRDRTAVWFHDIGVIVRKSPSGEIGFEILVGGGQGRTPMIGKTIREFIPKKHLLSYLEAILRVYNMLGRRDNKYKARIKILVHETGIDEFARLVDVEWATIKDGVLDLPEAETERIEAHFQAPDYEVLTLEPEDFTDRKLLDRNFDNWLKSNVSDHKQPGYAVVTLSLKPVGSPPGDVTADQMDAIAGLSGLYSFGEIRVSHEQNLVFADVKKTDLYALWQAFQKLELATPNIGLIGDIIACPGLDYCSLANARSIPVAERISKRFQEITRQHDIGDLRLKISGCINACGHHHIGHIGILGVDRRGEEHYQITLGGSADEAPAIGNIVGPSFSSDEVVDAVETIVDTYLDLRKKGESFIDAYRRLGKGPFKERLYPEKTSAAA